MFDQIVEQEYVHPEQVEKVVPEVTEVTPIPFGKTGVWVFKDGELIAYGGILGVTIEYERPLLDLRSRDGWTTFVGGLPEGTWHIEDLNVIYHDKFDTNEVMHIIYKKPDGSVIEADVIWVNYSYASGASDPRIRTTADFRIVGEATLYYD